jgi:hypothetical protein
MLADLAAFIKLPPAPYDACDKVTARVSSLSLVRYKWGAARLSETSGCGKLNRNRRLRDVD